MRCTNGNSVEAVQCSGEAHVGAESNMHMLLKSSTEYKLKPLEWLNPIFEWM